MREHKTSGNQTFRYLEVKELLNVNLHPVINKVHHQLTEWRKLKLSCYSFKNEDDISEMFVYISKWDGKHAGIKASVMQQQQKRNKVNWPPQL